MNYEIATNQQINSAVAKALGFRVVETTPGDKILAGMTGAGDLTIYDWCNRWSDAGAIIESIWDDLMSTDVNHNTEWDQEIKTDDRSDKLRAAMIVFLKMNESKHLP